MTDNGLFDASTRIAYKVDVILKDPWAALALKDHRGGVSRGNNSASRARYRDGGVFKDLDPWGRMNRAKRRIAFKDELSFHVQSGRGNVSEITFLIDEASDWTFDKTPFHFTLGGETAAGFADTVGASAVRRGGREAAFRVRGWEETDRTLHYTLRFRDKSGALREHDPVVKSGQRLPFLDAPSDEEMRDLLRANDPHLKSYQFELSQSLYDFRDFLDETG